MGEVSKDQFASIKQVFYDAFDKSQVIKDFAIEFGYSINGSTMNIYRLHDGIHIGYHCNMDGVTENEIYDVLSTAVRDFVSINTNDASLANCAKENIKSLAKILFIDKQSFTVII